MSNKLNCSKETQVLIVSVLNRLGSLNYRDEDFELMNDIVTSDSTAQILPSLQCYKGSWRLINEKLQRHGPGLIVWPDGSFYQGYLLNDRVNDYGRLIHADADVYQGNWSDD